MTNEANTHQAPENTLTMGCLHQMADLLKNIPPEPIGEWMRAQGRPPEQWRVVFPRAILDKLDGPVAWPGYVSFSGALERPVFLPRGLMAMGFQESL